MRAKIYIASSVRAPRAHQNGIVGYVIEAETSKGAATLTKFGAVRDVTANGAILLGLKNALSRIRTECDVIIYTDCGYVASAYAYGWIDGWIGREWRTLKGEPVANREQWEQIVGILGSREPVFEIGTEHNYKKWLENEVEKRAKAHKY